MSLPPFESGGDLPQGVHPATMAEILQRFGAVSVQRNTMALRLERIYHIAQATGDLARCIVFGSFVTTKAEPNDVDVFLLMEDSFDFDQLTGETRLLFEHDAAQAHFGASVFWLRRMAAFLGEQATIEHWQMKRDGGQRGIVEIIREGP